MSFFQAATRERNAIAAQQLWDELFPLCEFICAKSHIRVAHTGLEIAGRPVGPPRRPLRPLGPDDRARLSQIIAALDDGSRTQPKMRAQAAG
jgi:4-hydroxy-tetrahydrodipicolinate synthase